MNPAHPKKLSTTQSQLLRISLLAIFLFSTTHCKHRSSSASNLDAFERDYEDTFFLSSDVIRSSDACRAQLVNIASNSLADGLLINGAIAGLGTDTPTGKKLSTDGAYTQALRVYSIFDWEMRDRLIQSRQSLCLPEKVHIAFTSSAKDATSSMGRPFPTQVKKVRDSFASLTKDSWSLDIIEVDGYTPPSLWPRIPQGSSDYRKILRSGYLARLSQIENFTARGTDLRSKLKAIAMAYSPLGVTFDASFPPSGPGKGKTFLEVYLPPLAELRTPSADEAESWYIEKGIQRRELPRPYDIGIAKLTHIAYLPPGEKKGQPVIKFKLFKDYAAPDIMRTHVVFGKVAEDGPEKGLLPLDYRDKDTALVIGFYPNLAEYPSDSSTIRYLKKEVNKVINAFRVDARIHQLAVDFAREAHGDPVEKGADSVMLRPRFSMRGSDISFRLFVDTDGGIEVTALKALGFSCEQGPSSKTCHRDFGSYKDTSEFFEEGPKGIVGQMRAAISQRFQSLLNLLVKYNAKILINWNIAAIEEAINQQFMAITQDITENQFEVRSRIQERMERLIFEAK